MNISEFKSKMESYGGPARSSLFMVEILNAGFDEMPDEDIRMFCRSGSIPGISLNTFEYKPQGHGQPMHLPSGFSTAPFEAIFMLDSYHHVLKFFHQWMQKVVNYSTSTGLLSMTDGMHPYEIGFKEEYSTTIRIRFFSPNSDTVYETLLHGAYPTNIGSISLSWEENDTVATLPVSFSYSAIEFSGELPGIMTDRFSRSTGIVGKITSLGNSNGQYVYQPSQSHAGNSIQDAINRLTRIKDGIFKIKRLLS